MTQNERVKEIRQTLKLTLEKFGEPIGLKKSALSLIENGKNSLTDANIKAICREFGVDYIWLTTGEGEMFVESDDEFLGRIDQVMAGENEARKNMIKTLLYASDDDIEVFDRLVDYYYTLKYGETKKTDGI
jgi:transcriptional regulator with XRE-family HTH domain